MQIVQLTLRDTQRPPFPAPPKALELLPAPFELSRAPACEGVLRSKPTAILYTIRCAMQGGLHSRKEVK
jgi:hypothetical protein